MQLKGLVKFFAVVLILISLYQLSFTLVVHQHEKKIAAAAQTWLDKNYPSAEQKFPGNKEEQAFYNDFLDSVIRAREQYIEDSTADVVIYNTGIKKYTYQ
ncbi:MAG TPA: hypothetical protein VIU45_06400, partial [Chitinophagaceae bacterium]